MNGQVKIRKASVDDAVKLLNIYAYYVEKTAVSFEYDVPSDEEFAKRIENTHKKYPYLVAECDGEIIGYAYAGVFKSRAAYDHSVEMTVYVDKNKKRRGTGRMLYEALEKELADMNIFNLYACIAMPEKEDEYLTRDSFLFHNRLGFHKVGEFHACGCKFGRFYNMIWMEKLIGTRNTDSVVFQ